MIHPDGTGSESSRPKTGRATLFVVAVLVIVAGFLALGSLSPAEPIAVETTTTTSPTTTVDEIEPAIDLENFRVEQIAIGEPLVWRHRVSIDDGNPIALLEHNDALYLFVNESPSGRGGDGGMTAWIRDGEIWRGIGEVIEEEFIVRDVTSNGEELIAAGRPVDGPGLTIWRSPDGFSWTRSEVPVDPRRPNMSTYSNAIGATDGLVVVASTTFFDIQRFIAQTLREAGFDIDLIQWNRGTDWTEDDGQILTVQGPFGMLVERIPLEQLELTQDERSWISGQNIPTPEIPFEIWRQRDGEPWRRSQVGGMRGAETILPRPDGGLIAIGFGGVKAMSVTEDGSQWRLLDPNRGSWTIDRWGDRLVAPADMSVPEVLVSGNGQIWVEAGLAEYFPQTIGWSIQGFAAGPGGVAMAVNTAGATWPPETPDPTTLLLGEGVALIIDYADESLTLHSGNGTYVWQMYGPTDEAEPEIDVNDGVVRFSHPETGEPLGSIGIDELRAAEQEFFIQRHIPRQDRAFVFTSDTENWIIQNLNDVFGEKAVIADLDIADGQVTAIVFPNGEPFFPQADFHFEVWSAELP